MACEALLNSIPTLVGAVIGAAASIVATILTNRNSMKQRIEDREAEYDANERRFQRENYLSIQPLLLDLIRGVFLTLYEDEKSFRETGKWDPKNKLSDEVDKLCFEATRELAMRTERVADDAMRERLQSFRHEASHVAFLSYQEEKQYVEQMGALYDEVTAELGKEIRRLAVSNHHA